MEVIKMKKLLAMLLALVMVFALCACEEEPSGATPSSPSTTGSEDQPESKNIKIGVIFYSKDDSLGQLVYSYLNYAAEHVDGLEVQWALGSMDANSQVADAENLIAAGCDGIMALTVDDLAIQQIANVCNESGVYFQVMFRAPNSEDISAVLEGYDYYLGYAIEDTVATSYHSIEILADDGVSRIAVGTNTHSATSTLRNSGMESACADLNIERIAQFDLGSDVSSIQSDLQNILDSYDDIEAVWLMSGSQGIAEICVNTLRAHKEATGETIGLMTFDPFDGMAQAFEDGILYGDISGQAPLCLAAFASLYNAIDGHPLSEEKVAIQFPFLIVTSSEDLTLFEENYNNPEVQLYDAEIIQSMLYRYNPDVSLEQLQEFWSSFSMDWIKENVVE